MTASTAVAITTIGQRLARSPEAVLPQEEEVRGGATTGEGVPADGVPAGLTASTACDGVGAAFGLEPPGIEIGICPLARDPPVPSTRSARSAWTREAGEN